MSRNTRNTNISTSTIPRVATRTVAGSYEAPVEGLVDYGAFSRGFESAFKTPTPKIPKPLDDDLLEVDTNVNGAEGTDVTFTSSGMRSLGNTILSGGELEELKVVQRNAKATGNSKLFKETQKRLQQIIDGKNGLQLLADMSAENYAVSDQRGSTPLGYSQKGRGIDSSGLASAINGTNGSARMGFGKDDKGNDVFGVYITRTDYAEALEKDVIGEAKEIIKDAKNTLKNFKFDKVDLKSGEVKGLTEKKSLMQRLTEKTNVDFGETPEFKNIRIPKIKGVAGAQNSFFIPTEDLTKEDILLKYFPPKANLLDNASAINKDKNLDLKISELDIVSDLTSIQYKSSKTGKIITEDSNVKVYSDNAYKKIDAAAEIVARDIVVNRQFNDNKPALYLDAVYGQAAPGTSGKITGKTPVSNFITGFKNEEGESLGGFLYNDVLYTPEMFKAVGANGKIGGDIPLEVKDALTLEYAKSQYKVNFGSGSYVFDENGHAIKSAIPVDQKTASRIPPKSNNRTIVIGGGSVDEEVGDVFAEVNKFGRSDDVFGTLFEGKSIITGDGSKPNFDREMLVDVRESSSGNGEKLVVFDLNKGTGEDPKYIAFDFGYSMSGDAPSVNVDGQNIKPKTVQNYMMGRFGGFSPTKQNKYSKQINDVLDARKKKFAEINPN